MRSVKIILLLLVVVAAAITWGPRYSVPSRVGYHVIQQQVVKLEILGPGLVDAINKVAITTRIQGFLVAVEADKNDAVRRGQILAQLESTDLRNLAAAAQSDAEAARIAVLEAERDRDRVNAVQARAQAEFSRKSALTKSGSVTLADFSNAEAALKEAEANLARVTTSIERSKAQSSSAYANLKVLQAKLAEATIRSPIDGVVVARDRNIGDLLPSGASLMQIVDPSSIIVSARFDESTMYAIRPGQRATVRFASDPETLYEGNVLRVIRQVDRETREYVVDISLSKLPDSWAINQRATVSIEAQSSATAIVVPRDYVVRQDGRPGVWIDRKGRAVWIPVSTGYASGSNVQITGGLSVGDVTIDPRGRFSYERVLLGEELK